MNLSQKVREYLEKQALKSESVPPSVIIKNIPKPKVERKPEPVLYFCKHGIDTHEKCVSCPASPYTFYTCAKGEFEGKRNSRLCSSRAISGMKCFEPTDEPAPPIRIELKSKTMITQDKIKDAEIVEIKEELS
jgi:hypothetical protein